MRRFLLTIVAALVSFVGFAQTEVGSSCANPSTIGSLPFSAEGVSTIDTCHYNLADYTMRSGNYVFAFTPAENMAVNISISSISRNYNPTATSYTSYPNVGLFLYQGCPDATTPQLVGTPFVSTSATTTSGAIRNANLTAGNEYFIVVAADSLIVDPVSIFGYVITEGAASYTTATFNISVSRVVEHDIAIQSVTASESTCGESTTISYTVRNNGESAVEADAVTVTCNVNGNNVANENIPAMEAGASVNMTFENIALAEGDNTVILTATYAIDENNTNNTQTITAHRNIVVASYPYTEDFEAATTAWTPSANGAWTILADDNNNHYYKTDTAVSTSSNITGPCFSFANMEMPEIHFDVKANFPTLSGDLSEIGSMFGGLGDISFSVKSALLASTNGGSSWDTVAHIDATTGWVNKNISLARYAGESSVMFRIYYNVGLSGIAALMGITTVGGEGVAVDNIVIKDAPQNDLGITNITAPLSGCGLANAHVAVVVKNFGRQAQSNYTVKYSLDEGATWTEETISASIAAGATYNYTFNASTNLSTYGEYNILASTGDDEDNTNNTAEKLVISQGTYTNAEVIFDDVYNSDPQYRIINDWYPEGNNSSWAFGKTANGTDSTWTWATNPNGPANDNETSFLYSPCYDLSGMVNPIVKIYLKYHMSSIDMGEVEDEEMPLDPSSMFGMFGGNLSLQYTLNGTAWITVNAGELNEGWYSSNELMGEISEPGWSGNSNGFISVKTSLTFPTGADLTSVKFRFSFKTSSMGMGEEIPFDISGFMGGNINGAAIAQFIVYGCPVPVPSASFTYTNEPCSGTVVFTNTSENADSYAWNFGDGLSLNLGDLTGETGFDISGLFGDGSTTSTEENPTMNYTTDGTYNVVLTATNECGTSVATDSIAINLCTEIEENASNEISIYPNPANNMITIANAENATVEIINALGQTVAVKNAISNNQTIDISELANGTYFIKINENVIKVNVIR